MGMKIRGLSSSTDPETPSGLKHDTPGSCRLHFDISPMLYGLAVSSAGSINGYRETKQEIHIVAASLHRL